METLTIVQKRLWNEKEFRLDDGILHLKEVGLFSGFETELRFEDIIGEKRAKRRPNYLLFGAAAFLMWLSMINMFGYADSETVGVFIPSLGGIMAAVLFYITYQGAQEVLYLDTVNDESIGFFRDGEHQKSADDFVSELLQQQKVFLVEKYWDCVDCQEQKLHNLDWLKNRNIVNIEEFKRLKEVESEKMRIGFRR